MWLGLLLKTMLWHKSEYKYVKLDSPLGKKVSKILKEINLRITESHLMKNVTLTSHLACFWPPSHELGKNLPGDKATRLELQTLSRFNDYLTEKATEQNESKHRFDLNIYPHFALPTLSSPLKRQISKFNSHNEMDKC